MEEVLSDSQVILLLIALTNHSMDNCLENVIFWYNTIHILDKVVSISGLIILKVVSNKIQTSLRNYIDKGRKYLQGVLSTSENNQIMSQQIIVLEHVSAGG